MELTAILTLMGCFCAFPEGINYDESKVPAYTLPDPLTMEDDTKVTDAKTWKEKRRPELLKLFEEYMYGKSPGKLESTTFEVTSVDSDSLDGKAIRKEVSVYFTDKKDGQNNNS